jgi:hypothetical protein
MSNTQPRQSEGTPSGGQWAATQHAEPDLSLTLSASPVDIDTKLTKLQERRQRAERSLKFAPDDPATKALIKELDAEMNALEKPYYQNPWERYYVVPGGHIHGDLRCGSLHSTTFIGLLPNLSGKAAGDAVAEEGKLLCSHCFPDAPSEWTKPAPKDPADYCPGSGKEPAERRRGNTSWMDGKCPECGEWQRGVAVGTRKHKRRKA